MRDQSARQAAPSARPRRGRHPGRRSEHAKDDGAEEARGPYNQPIAEDRPLRLRRQKRELTRRGESSCEAKFLGLDYLAQPVSLLRIIGLQPIARRCERSGQEGLA